ncbi:GNAT family N-acetyltransferase [Chryseobacterium scophthalmum]|uniref:GNAT family N-acetyltransferase n=1 Tax=Chryseobacterium scophthalmum TaxID=59733 RepID=UPI001AEBEFC7|nr:GNAT family N-acetyltransferase [Chryseobacterium scophthalmum]
MSIIVRNAKVDDLNKIVEIHLERFTNFFLTTLGKSFLKTFYKAFLKAPGILLVILDNNEIKGFAAGSRDNRNFFRKLLKNNLLDFALSGVNILFTNPEALKRIFTNTKHSEEVSIAYAELLSIATVSNKQGYGKVLLDHFENDIILKNKENLPISLTTDYENNDKAVKFYKDCGYEILEVFESYQKRKMYRFIKNI